MVDSDGVTQSRGSRIVHDSSKTVPQKLRAQSPPKVPSYLLYPLPPPRNQPAKPSSNISNEPAKSVEQQELPSSSTLTAGNESSNAKVSSTSSLKDNVASAMPLPIASPLQINEVTSSDGETPPPIPQRPPGGHGTAANKRRSLCRELADLQNNASSMISGKYFECATLHRLSRRKL